MIIIHSLLVLEGTRCHITLTPCFPPLSSQSYNVIDYQLIMLLITASWWDCSLFLSSPYPPCSLCPSFLTSILALLYFILYKSTPPFIPHPRMIAFMTPSTAYIPLQLLYFPIHAQYKKTRNDSSFAIYSLQWPHNTYIDITTDRYNMCTYKTTATLLLSYLAREFISRFPVFT